MAICVIANNGDIVRAAEGDVQLQGGDGLLNITILLRKFYEGSHGSWADLGQNISCEARVQNISSNIVRIPSPEACFDFKMKKTLECCGYGVGSFRVSNVATLAPGDVLEFSGQATLLNTNICNATVSFHNSLTQQGNPSMVSEWDHTTAMVPIENVWTGRISLSTVIRVNDALYGNLGTKYWVAMKKVLAFESAAQSITNFDRPANSMFDINHRNVTQQSEVLDLIRQIGADANSKAVDWLWGCIDETAKNSPVRFAAISELYQLLTKGIGCEKADRFIGIARAGATEESIAVRLYAMDAIGLCCVREYFLCDLKGNWFSTRITPETQRAALDTLKVLTGDPLKDIQTRAKQMLGISVQKERQGRRKYIKQEDAKVAEP